jgi:hypothetical protein
MQKKEAAYPQQAQIPLSEEIPASQQRRNIGKATQLQNSNRLQNQESVTQKSRPDIQQSRGTPAGTEPTRQGNVAT